VYPLRLLVTGLVGVGVSLYFRAAHQQLLGWKRTGDPRVKRWEDTGELGAWKIMLPVSVLLAVVGAVALVAETVF
jgi:hypothetical protein